MADSTPSSTIPTITVTATKPAPHGGVSTYQPKLSVVLKKTVQRTTVGADIAAAERFTGAKRTIDLTPFLGEGDVVQVSKSVREPAGMFSVSFRDQMLGNGFLDSIYGLAEPMDVVEISMARNTAVYASKYPNGLPIMMRGFVSDVWRGTAMGPGGPVRTVTLAGQDYGKILSLIRPLYLPGIDPSADLLTNFGLFTNYGVDATQQDASDFITQVMNDVVNQGGQRPGFLATLIGKSPASPIQYIIPDAQSGGGVISPIGTQAWRGGSIYDLFKAFGDVGAWRELYVEDRDDGPYLVYRPTPFKDLTGAYIQSVANPPTRNIVYDDSIVSFDVGRSDGNVANYYNVTANRYQLADASWMQVYALNTKPSPYVSDYPNCDPALYGLRVLEADTEQGYGLTGLSQSDYQAAVQAGQGIIADRRTSLIAMNQDNAVLESGDATLRGWEAIKAGTYLRMVRGQGQVKSDFYVPQVAHTFTVGRSYVTQAVLERGTGFVSRLQSGASPYLAELDLRGVYASAG